MMKEGALSGVRILDFTRVLSGPYCTALMADLGAEVIKVESPTGDDYRHIGPFEGDESLLFQTVNRGKRSIALDLKQPEDLKIARALAAKCDVVVENFRSGVMDRLGLGYAALATGHPGLIYLSITGFGQSGPMADLPAYDITIQALSGIMELTGEPDGPPTMIGEAIGDVAGGLFAAWALSTALYHREKTGKGQQIDVALFDALMAMLPTAACRTLLAGQCPTRTGNRHSLSAPFGTYAAGEGYFALAVLNNRLFQRFCTVIARDEFATDPRFATDSLRRENEPILAEAIEAWAANDTALSVVDRLSEAGIPAAPLFTAQQAWISDQVAARGLASLVAHPVLGDLTVPEQPVQFSAAPRGGRRAAPALDADRAMILALLQEENRP